jgi:hypothetical protein
LRTFEEVSLAKIYVSVREYDQPLRLLDNLLRTPGRIFSDTGWTAHAEIR